MKYILLLLVSLPLMAIEEEELLIKKVEPQEALLEAAKNGDVYGVFRALKDGDENEADKTSIEIAGEAGFTKLANRLKIFPPWDEKDLPKLWKICDKIQQRKKLTRAVQSGDVEVIDFILKNYKKIIWSNEYKLTWATLANMAGYADLSNALASYKAWKKANKEDLKETISSINMKKIIDYFNLDNAENLDIIIDLLDFSTLVKLKENNYDLLNKIINMSQGILLSLALTDEKIFNNKDAWNLLDRQKLKKYSHDFEDINLSLVTVESNDHFKRFYKAYNGWNFFKMSHIINCWPNLLTAKNDDGQTIQNIIAKNKKYPILILACESWLYWNLFDISRVNNFYASIIATEIIINNGF